MIKIKLLDILKKQGRNLNWLATNAGITYSALYNFAHQNTNSVSYDILEKICKTLRCNVDDIIEYTPTGIDLFPQSSLEMLENAVNTLTQNKSNNKGISEDEENFLYQLFNAVIQDIIANHNNKNLSDLERFNTVYRKTIKYNLLSNDLIFKLNTKLWNIAYPHNKTE